MTLDEYEQIGRAVYVDFADVVAAILGAALKTNGSVRVQVIQKRAKASSEVRKKLDGAVTDIEAKVSRVPSTGLSELPGDPLRGWMRGSPQPQKPTSAMAQDENTIQKPERNRRHHE